MLPQATAFGIALWAPYQQEPAAGAIAGIITAIFLCFFSGLSRGTAGMVSSPTGPTFVLISGALVSLSASGYSGMELVNYLALMLLMTGILQVIIGLTNGGRLIKFIPYPVVAGFMTGSAFLMIMSQAKMLEFSSYAQMMEQGLWLPWLTAAITFAAMIILPKILPMIPGTVSGLVTGTIAFHVISQFSGLAYPAQWIVGQLPDLASLHVVIPYPEKITDIPWLILLPMSVALAVLSSLDTLLTSVIADVSTGERHNSKRELVGQGVGQALAAVFGGIAGASTTGATLVSLKSGGRYGAAIVSAITFIFILALLGPAVSLLPISVLAGIILYVAIMGMLERDILAWFKRRKTRLDAATAILVISVTVAYDLMVAVGVGLLLATFQFVRAQITSPVIHRRSTVAQHPSLRRRSEQQRNLLNQHAESIIIYELKGQLFFGTVDHLFEEISADLNRPAQIIFDMARVQQVDLTALRMFQHMADYLHKAKGELIFTNVRGGKGLSHKVEKTLRKISPHRQGNYPVRTFIDVDEAVEYAEDTLLKALGETGTSFGRVEPENSALFRGLPEETTEAIREVLKKVSLRQGEYLFRKGDIGSDLYVVVEGEIDILLPYAQHHYKRL
ncbi:MAG TPA: SulP family inorganic anion transporter, partial [Gammaproteobacteria bacterium]